jgi:hypothetical protein
MRKAGVLSILFVVVLVAFAVIAEAQQPKRVPRIGFLTGSPSVFLGRIEAFRRGCASLGTWGGKNIVIEWRYTEGKLDRYPALAGRQRKEDSAPAVIGRIGINGRSRLDRGRLEIISSGLAGTPK